MYKNIFKLGVVGLAIMSLYACEDEQSFVSVDNNALRVEVNTLSPEMQKVRDYVPPMAVAGHRGTVYWAPEETEASWRWAREEGVDYLESDLQMSKDGVILANHDDNLCRTTNVEILYGTTVPKTRVQWYMDHGCSKEEAEKLYKKDIASFEPYYTKSYMYEELLKLDAGSYFKYDPSSAERWLDIFEENHLYVSTLEDQIKYAEGYRLKRDSNGERVYSVSGKWNPEKPLDCIKYTFEYEDDPADTGNRPGIYIEFKESWLNPSDFVDRVYKELSRLDWNIIEKPADENEPFYKNGKINVGNTNGKVILQTFSLSALQRTNKVFKGQIPMCYLLWKGTYATDLKEVTPEGYADFINMAISYNAHIIGPCIAGAPNNYPELTAPWMAYLVRKSGLLNHPYSFDSLDQMGKYLGIYDYGVKNDFSDILNYKGADNEMHYGVRLDGLFTNRAELTIDYMDAWGFRDKDAPKPLKEEPQDVLKRLYAN